MPEDTNRMPTARLLASFLAGAAVWTAPGASLGQAGAPAGPADGPPNAAAQTPMSFDFRSLRLEYSTPHPEFPLIESMHDLSLPVTITQDGLISVSADDTNRLGDLLTLEEHSITAGALNELASAIVAELNRRGLVGVLVAPDPDQIDPATGRDLRPGRGAGRSDLTVRIWIGLVRELRSVASGGRFPEGGTNLDAHRRILNLSPAKPWDGTSKRRQDLIRREVLENYVYRLNRQPNRRVDIAVAAASQPGSAPDATSLEYLVRESRPWTAYAQVSNTGTEQTNEWRQRFGFVHNQATGRDDTLQLDFVTSSFEDTFAGIGSYEAPLPGTTMARARVFGSFSDYTASDIGLPGLDLSGTTVEYGGELILTAYQRRSLFVDVFGGLVGKSFEVTNDLAATEGDTTLFLATAGVRIEDRQPARSFTGEVAFDWTIDGGSSNELPALGRLDVDEFWTRLRWDTQASFYLEPLLWPRAWRDTSTPGSSTLAHEVALSFRGQSVFDARVIPQEQSVVGGLYSVRGYPESATAGDITYILSAEYRLHIPALLGISEQPGTLFGEPFRWRRDRAYGSADWDLVLAGFIDYGESVINDQEPGEFQESLVGVGFGIGLDIKRNVRIRADWGFALNDLDGGDTEAGDNEVHFVATIAY